VIKGRVQGVLYRWSTVRRARSSGIKGWIRNLPNGQVEALIEGEETDVKKLLDWMKVGPERAVVERVEIDWQPYVGELSDFRIIK